MAQTTPPPVPAGAVPAISFVVVSTATEAAALKAGQRLVWLQRAQVYKPGRSRGRATPMYSYVWVNNLASILWHQNPGAYTTVAALNSAASAFYASQNNTGGLLGFMQRYVQPAVMALVLVEAGGAAYSGVMAPGAGAVVPAAPVAIGNTGLAPYVDTSLPGLSSQELAATTAANEAAAASSGYSLLDLAGSPVGKSVAGAAVTKIAAMAASSLSPSRPGTSTPQPATSAPANTLMVGLLAALGIGLAIFI